MAGTEIPDPSPSPLTWLMGLLMALDLNFLYIFFRNQFRRLPLPQDDFTGQTIIVTGANIGIGLEAARHFVRLRAARVIIACRTAEKGERARASLERQSAAAGAGAPPATAVDFWPLDLRSFDSVRAFCARAAADLERVDVLVENAAVARVDARAEMAEGWECTVAVNVISTFLMALLMLPVLRRTAVRFNTRPRLVVVSSDAHFMTTFKERNLPCIFDAFRSTTVPSDRYQTSKLLEILVVRRLAREMLAPGSATRGGVVLNTVNPGFCRTALFRDNKFPASAFLWCTSRILGRSAESGSRCLVYAAAAGPETHGVWLDSCEEREPSAFVRSKEGEVVGDRVYEELMGILEGVEPGVTENI